jgi:predicted NBD/HSP70 family sugar kinase
VIDIKLIVELANKGDVIAIEVLKETARYLGLGLAPIIYSLNPEAMVIGGRLVSAWSIIDQEIRDSCSKRVSQPFLENTRLQTRTDRRKTCRLTR